MVRREPRRGKGEVVRRMFADIEADVYIMVDGDGTYDAGSARKMVAALIEDNLDMVIGRRPHAVGEAYRRGPRDRQPRSRLDVPGLSSAASSRTWSPATG